MVQKKRYPVKCLKCKFWVFTTTLGSMDIPEWHCKYGFTPYEDCINEAMQTKEAIKLYYRKHPEDLQLHFNF